MEHSLYCKSFRFEAVRMEEYQDGMCLKSTNCSTVIIANFEGGNSIEFSLKNDVPANINNKFELPILGIDMGDILEDRIQYGRIPDSFSWEDPNEPVVCNIFLDKPCIRFAMMSPLRIVEFYGKYM